MPTVRCGPRYARANCFVDACARRALHATVRWVISPRLPTSLHRRLYSARASAGDAERASSRERDVVPTERHRPRRARADRFDDARAHRAVRAAVRRVTSPRLSSSSHRRLGSVRAGAGDAERASSRERVVEADRAPPTTSCACRSLRLRTHAPCRARRRASDDIPAPALFVASPARLCQSRRRRRRASAESRRSPRADRAPPTLPCVRRSLSRRMRGLCYARRRASGDLTTPALLVASPARLHLSRLRPRRTSAKT